MGDLNDFSSFMLNVAKNVPNEVDKVVQATGKAVLKSVTDSTPIDTGAAVSNWQASQDGGTGVIDPLSPGVKGSTAQENRDAAYSQGVAQIDEYHTTDGVGTLHVANAVTYIEDLNNGTSRQAPAGFVDTAVLEGVAAAQKAGYSVDVTKRNL